MPKSDDDLIDDKDLKLTADEISAKALALVRSIGLTETEEAEKAMAAKARAYFKRAAALREPRREHAPSLFPSMSEMRWKARHEAKTWEEIREEWISLRNKTKTLAERGLSADQIESLQELTRLECFIEDSWTDQRDVIDQISADRMTDREQRPPFGGE